MTPDLPLPDLPLPAGSITDSSITAGSVADRPITDRPAAVVPVPDGPFPAGLTPDDLPAYVYDLASLDEHAAAVRAALPGIELYYAVKANPDPELLRVLARHVDGFEVSSGGELAHVRGLFPGARVALGGPGKTG
ncbi:type III PLP-dependent enzyme, partial [Streptosporangium canum]